MHDNQNHNEKIVMQTIFLQIACKNVFDHLIILYTIGKQPVEVKQYWIESGVALGEPIIIDAEVWI